MDNAYSHGLVGLFARHRTAANLLMGIMILCGLVSLTRINKQFFPTFEVDVITISIIWPGASADDVDSNIIQALEPELRFLDGVTEVKSSSFEGLASVMLEYDAGSDMQSALSDVESAVGQVTTFPDDSERPRISRILHYETIARIVLSGPFPTPALKSIAKRMRDDLLARGIDKIDIFGAPDEEIWVEIQPEVLRRLALKPDDIASRIRAISQDIPSGEISQGERQIRSLGLLKNVPDLENLEVLSLANGRKLYLGDIADISDTYEEGAPTAVRNGMQAVELHVRRAVSADALESSALVRKYLKQQQGVYPDELDVELFNVESDMIQGRLDILLKNGATGLLLVLAILFIFLNGRVAFWVAAGIPASLMATMGFMLLTGQTINMVSMFGLIMAIGIVVDDAIVVGEHAQARASQGLDSMQAAISGASRMAAPVFSSTLTTIAAFMPILLIGSIMGKIMSAIPLVVITVLIASLVECFLVLPGHLRDALGPHKHHANSLLQGFRNGFDRRFEKLRAGPFRRLVSLAVGWRYSLVALTLMGLVLAVGLLAGGRVGFQFFPSPEADRIYVNIDMVAGTGKDRTQAMLLEIERALSVSADTLSGPEDKDLIQMSLIKLGTTVGSVRGGGGSTDNIGGLIVEMKTADTRNVRVPDLIKAWRDEIQTLPGLNTMTIRASRGGPPGRDIDVRLFGKDVMTLKKASEEVQQLMARLPGVSDVNDDLPWGKPETILELTPRGHALGFTTTTVGRQVRNALEGAIAKRFPRADEEVLIRVMYQRDEVTTDILDRLYLRSPSGNEVPLRDVVSFRDSIGFAVIRREDGQREVRVTAEIDPQVTSMDTVINALIDEGLVEIARNYNLQYAFGGRAEEQKDTFADMKVGVLVGLSAIYIILAWVFSSYMRPLVVMAIIPAGFIGAVVGHYIMGFNLTILSLVALIGLSGIVINDSIVLVTTIDERRQKEPLREAIIDGACDRLRAVFLTSATTISGLTPLIFEKSVQAQFLIPMALTIVFGLAVTTFVVLLLVPALIAIQDDFAQLFTATEKPVSVQ